MKSSKIKYVCIDNTNDDHWLFDKEKDLKDFIENEIACGEAYEGDINTVYTIIKGVEMFIETKTIRKVNIKDSE